MTNISCTKNCIYQKDGKCDYSEVYPSQPQIKSDCAYFIHQINYPNAFDSNENNILK